MSPTPKALLGEVYFVEPGCLARAPGAGQRTPVSRARNAADAILEASVVGSFTRIGSLVRRRLDDWDDLSSKDLSGRVVVITGATSGLGRATASRLAKLGAEIVVVARDSARAQRTCEELREETARQGLEQTVACHVVGPFLLTTLLLPALRAAAPSRVVWVSSGGMYTEPLDVAALATDATRYGGVAAYARAKRAQVTLSEMLAERAIVGPLLRSPEEGSDTLAWLVADDGEPLASTGRFWLDRRARAIHRAARTRRSDTDGERQALWRWVTETSGATLGR